ncbi:MAG: anthranilate phosphoribosyltransferase [Alphaproteobacteria bacterium]
MSTGADIRPLIAKVAGGASLDAAEAERAFDILMSGEATPAQMGAFLMALRVRGETVDEITGAARIMRAKAIHIAAPEGTMDVVGTGGDGTGTLNISTAAAIVVAASGVPVAKHGNRAASSRSGASDVLAALGVNLDADFAQVKRALWEAGLCFLMAPRHHTAMRNVAGVRGELATRTIFNLLGPLSNPALVKRQFTGTFARQWIEPMARVLGNLGLERAWVVHSSDGSDELTTTGPAWVAELDGGKVRTFEVAPEDAGLKRCRMADLAGGDAEFNAAALRALLDGRPSGFRDTVCFEAGAALVIAGKAPDLRAGAGMAAVAIDSGEAARRLARLVEITNAPPPPKEAEA